MQVDPVITASQLQTFGPTAENIYSNAHQALMERNKDLLHKYVTETAFLVC